MADSAPDTFAFIKFLPPQSMLPSTKLLEQMSEAGQFIAQAQVSYGQAVMRANAAMFAAWLGQPPATPQEERPSVACLAPETDQV